jgi:hypothetical protein
MSVLCSFGILTKDLELGLPPLYWIPELHMDSHKKCFIAVSAKCSLTSFQLINVFSIGDQNWYSELLQQ